MKNFKKLYTIGFITLMLLMIYPSVVYGAKDKTKPIISSLTATPSVTNNTNQQITVKFRVSEKAKVTLKVYKGSSLVKIGLNGIYKTGNVSWAWAGIKSNGKYTVKIDAVDVAGNKGLTKTTIVNIDTVKPVISNLDTDSSFYNTTDANVFDPTAGSFAVYYDISEDARVTVKAFSESNPSGYVISSTNEEQDEDFGNYFEWDGQFGDTIVTDGEYKLEISATDKAGNISETKTITVIKDTTAPTLTPSTGLFEKNVFNLGEKNNLNYESNEPVIALLTITNSNNKMVYIDLVGSLLENVLTIINNVDLENPDVLNKDLDKIMREFPEPTEPKFVTSGSITWDGKDILGNEVAEGAYTYKLIFVDRVGKVKVTNGSVNVCDGVVPMILTESISTPFTPNGTNQVGIKYTLSKAATVSVKIYRDNVFVKELNNILGAHGENTVNWDGKDYDGNLVGAGTYTFKINAVDIANNSAAQTSGTLIIQ